MTKFEEISSQRNCKTNKEPIVVEDLDKVDCRNRKKFLMLRQMILWKCWSEVNILYLSNWRAPDQVSILSLLMTPEADKNAIFKSSINHMFLVALIRKSRSTSRGLFLATEIITFTEDELIEDGSGLIESLHITAECRGTIVAKVLIDNGSALNVCPLVTLYLIVVGRSCIKEIEW